MPFEVKQHVGDYEILGLLGAGGMGHVYRARNIISNRTEAMKVLLPDLTADRDLAVRFISEIRTLAGFDHPNIALLHTAFQFENQLIMMMEYVEGQTLEDRAKHSAIPILDVVEYISQTLSALGYAHARSVVHRDIKPANLMITSHGIVKLMDFGIAKPAVDNHLTRPGTTVGSLYYMSPEQVRGANIDARSDLYSTGIVLYELLAGRRPFESESTFGILNQQLNTAPQPPIEINPNLPPQLNAIILKALAKAPEERYQTAEEFRNELKRFAGKPITASPNLAATVIDHTPPPAAARPSPSVPAHTVWENVQPVAATPSSATPPPQNTMWEQVPVQTHTPTQVLPSTPTPPYPAPAQQVIPPYPAPSRKSGGNRSIWIATGALAAVLALLFVAFALPRHKTQASTDPQPTPNTEPTKPVIPIDPPRQSQQPPPQQALQQPPQQMPQQLPNQPRPYGTQPVDPRAHNPQFQGQLTAALKAPPQPQPAQPQPQPNIATPPPPAANAADVEQLQDRYIQLDGRAQAALRGVANIRKQQEASGLGMRNDIEASDQRLRSYMAAANQDVHGPRTAQAAREMDKAEAEISILEKFLGR